MTKPKQRTHIFLIHAHKDRAKVYKLYKRLSRDGVNVWLDAERLQPGQDWRKEINQALLGSAVVVVCLTGNFDKQRGYRHEELQLALEKARALPEDEIFVIPVRLESCDLPESLRHLHRVDVFKPGGYKKLLQALGGMTGPG